MKRTGLLALAMSLAWVPAAPAVAGDEAALDHADDRIERHLEHRGDRIDDRMDRRGDRIDDRMDRRRDRRGDRAGRGGGHR